MTIEARTDDELDEMALGACQVRARSFLAKKKSHRATELSVCTTPWLCGSKSLRFSRPGQAACELMTCLCRAQFSELGWATAPLMSPDGRVTPA